MLRNVKVLAIVAMLAVGSLLLACKSASAPCSVAACQMDAGVCASACPADCCKDGCVQKDGKCACTRCGGQDAKGCKGCRTEPAKQPAQGT